ncbi:hypothetical protein FJ656_31145, partial [Schumannella luteola]
MIASPRRSPTTRPLRPVAASAAALVLAAALAACASGMPGDGTSSSPPMPCAGSTDSPCATTSPSPTASPTPTATSAGLPDGAEQNLADAVSSGNTQAAEGYLADPTRVVIAASEADTQESPVDAVLALDYVQPGVGSWDFGLAGVTIEQYAGNPIYGAFFPPDAIVGRSDTGAVVSFV